MSHKEQYRSLCKVESTVPIFLRDWYLDAVAGDSNWDVVLYEKKGNTWGAYPFIMQQKKGFSFSELPPLTPFLGPWIKTPENIVHYHSRLQHNHDVLKNLIKLLPAHDFTLHRFSPEIDNLLPFIWNDFSTSVHYSYEIKDLTDLDSVFKHMGAAKSTIKKASQNLLIEENLPIDDFIQLNANIFHHKKLAVPYSGDLLKRLDKELAARNQRKIFYALNAQEKICAAVYLIWDEHKAYYLMSGKDYNQDEYGSNNLLLWKAIQFASTVTKSFDFEGSVIPSIEKFFRSFGAKQIPLYQVSKFNSKLLKLLFFLKGRV